MRPSDQMELLLEKTAVVIIKRFHLVLVGVVAFITPIVTSYGSYLKAQSDIQREFVQIRLEQEQYFVRKPELKEVSQKLDLALQELAKIRGSLEHRR